MNSLVSETKVVCNESIPNPITPIAIPVAIPVPSQTNEMKSLTVLNGHHVNKIKKDLVMRSEVKLASDEAGSPMECGSASVSPEHKPKVGSSSEDVAMSENTSVSIGFLNILQLLCCIFTSTYIRLIIAMESDWNPLFFFTFVLRFKYWG